MFIYERRLMFCLQNKLMCFVAKVLTDSYRNKTFSSVSRQVI